MTFYHFGFFVVGVEVMSLIVSLLLLDCTTSKLLVAFVLFVAFSLGAIVTHLRIQYWVRTGKIIMRINK